MFSKCNPEDGGGVKRIIMGLDRNTRYAHNMTLIPAYSCMTWTIFSLFRTPCGFCFVEFYTHAEALAGMRYVSGTKLERIIRCDLDLGYRGGRQFGRGNRYGPQKSASFHALNDATLWRFEMSIDKIMTPAEGGWGAQAQRIEIERRRQVEERYADWSRVSLWQSVVKIGSKHWHLLRNQLLSALGWMKILVGCNFSGTLCLYSIFMSCSVQSYICELRDLFAN